MIRTDLGRRTDWLVSVQAQSSMVVVSGLVMVDPDREIQRETEGRGREGEREGGREGGREREREREREKEREGEGEGWRGRKRER